MSYRTIFRCKFPSKCTPYLDYMKINSNDELDLIGSCLSKCDGLRLTNTFYVYMLNSSSNEWISFTNESFFYQPTESNTNLIVLNDLFKLYPHQRIWKIKFITTVLTFTYMNLTGESSILFYVNRPPLNGTCDIQPKNGSTNDLFFISCEKWSDGEGIVTSYSYYGKKIIFFTPGRPRI
jgi:hypothetical protein